MIIRKKKDFKGFCVEVRGNNSKKDFYKAIEKFKRLGFGFDGILENEPKEAFGKTKREPFLRSSFEQNNEIILDDDSTYYRVNEANKIISIKEFLQEEPIDFGNKIFKALAWLREDESRLLRFEANGYIFIHRFKKGFLEWTRTDLKDSWEKHNADTEFLLICKNIKQYLTPKETKHKDELIIKINERNGLVHCEKNGKEIKLREWEMCHSKKTRSYKFVRDV